MFPVIRRLRNAVVLTLCLFSAFGSGRLTHTEAAVVAMVAAAMVAVVIQQVRERRDVLPRQRMARHGLSDVVWPVGE